MSCTKIGPCAVAAFITVLAMSAARPAATNVAVLTSARAPASATVPTSSAGPMNAAASGIPGYITAAVADPARPPSEFARDADRKPAEVLAFTGVKPGDRVADFMSGGGYFTRLFSRIVGGTGTSMPSSPTKRSKTARRRRPREPGQWVGIQPMPT